MTPAADRLTATPFVPLPSPYTDFALVSLGAPVDDAHLRRTIERLAEHGVTSALHRHALGGFLILTAGGNRTGRAGSSIYGLSGLAMTTQRLLVPWAVPSIGEFRGIDPACGQYSSFLVEDGMATVSTDAFGYSPTFASEHSGLAIVSNRLHLHVMVMRALNLPVMPDVVAVNASLCSDHGFFAQQNALSRTLVRSVTKVPVNRDVVLGGMVGGVRQVQKRSLEEDLGTGAAEYPRLIDAGAERIVANTRAALEARFYENVLLEMSGGKDTRLVLGSAMSTSGWGERVQLKTRGAEADADVAIASGIAAMFGLSFFRGSLVDQFPLDIQQNLDFWRSYYFGEYHRLAAGAWSVRGENRSDLALGGANGEIYRRFWSGVLERDVAEGGTVEEFARRFVRRVTVPGAMAQESLDEVSEALAKELAEGYGPTLEEYVEDHYLRHRNRSHCGLRGYSVMHEQAIWYPLMAPELFAASRAVPFSVRRSGQIVHDVLMRLNPVLIDIPFDGSDPFADVDRSAVAPRWERRMRLSMDQSIEAWRDAEAEDSRRQSERRRGRRPLMQWSQLAGEVERQFFEALDLLRADEALLDPAIDGLERRFRAMKESNVRGAYQLASRVFAVADVLS